MSPGAAPATAGAGRPAEKQVGGVIVVGPTPPPNHGVTIMTGHLVGAVERAGLLAAHLDTADRRPVESVGRFDLTNVALALVHAARLVGLLARHPGAFVYAPISQGRWGFLRDAVLLTLARLARRGRIVHLHGSRFARFRAESGPLMRAAMRLAIGGAEQAWVLTDSLRGVFGDLVPGDRVHVVENCVSDPELERDRARDPSKVTILCIANLLPDKGHSDLLDALALIDAGAAAPQVEVRFVGEADPSTQAALERRCAALAARGIDAKLVGVADSDAKLEELSRADVFVCPSHDEGQPLVILEAMAAGLPILATDAGGIGETVEADRSGLLVPVRSPRRLAERLGMLIGDRELRDRLGAEARKRYQSRYRPGVFSERVASLLTRLTPARPGNDQGPSGPAGD